jgi:ketosteroid isomerase-like protein
MARSAFEVVGSFVSAINAHNLTALRSLMTEDHAFTDARGTKFFGADLMIDNWRQFFHAYPQYWISIDTNLAYGDHVGLFGESGGKWRVDGTIIPGSWKVTAAWLAEIENGKVRSWTICCDTAWVTPPSQRKTTSSPSLSIVEV